jgi:hypothetical protein
LDSTLVLVDRLIYFRNIYRFLQASCHPAPSTTVSETGDPKRHLVVPEASVVDSDWRPETQIKIPFIAIRVRFIGIPERPVVTPNPTYSLTAARMLSRPSSQLAQPAPVRKYRCERDSRHNGWKKTEKRDAKLTREHTRAQPSLITPFAKAIYIAPSAAKDGLVAWDRPCTGPPNFQCIGFSGSFPFTAVNDAFKRVQTLRFAERIAHVSHVIHELVFISVPLVVSQEHQIAK